MDLFILFSKEKKLFIETALFMIVLLSSFITGEWEIPFLKRETTIQPFKVAPGHTKNVPTMTGTHVYGFVKDSSLQCSAVELPYKGNDLTMVIILPDDDFGLEVWRLLLFLSTFL